MPDEVNPEFLALAVTRASLKASIDARGKTKKPTVEFQRVTNQERARLQEVEKRMEEIEPELTKALRAKEAEPAK